MEVIWSTIILLQFGYGLTWNCMRESREVSKRYVNKQLTFPLDLNELQDCHEHWKLSSKKEYFFFLLIAYR